MSVVVAPDHVRHDVATGVRCGVTEASDELPARAEILATACAAAGAPLVEAVDHGLDALLRVHDLQFLRVLQAAYQRWVADGHLESPGIPYVTPYFFPPVAGTHGGVRGVVLRPSAPRSGSLLADVARFRPDAIVVSLGVDAAADDPNSPLLVSDAGFVTVGRLLAHLDRPTVFVHEGGYVLQTLAQHTMAVLEGFESRPGW